jgi:hypothetical protein
MFGRTFIEQSDQSCKFAPELANFAIANSPGNSRHLVVRCMQAIRKGIVITGLVLPSLSRAAAEGVGRRWTLEHHAGELARGRP